MIVEQMICGLTQWRYFHPCGGDWDTMLQYVNSHVMFCADYNDYLWDKCQPEEN
jgi:hypothetical protein